MNWSRVGHGVGLFGGMLYLRQWYDNRELVIRQLYGSREVAVTSVIESQRVTATNMAARTYARASCRSGCEDIFLKVLKLCLQNDAEAKINTNLDKLRSTVEVIDDGILVNI